MKTIKIEDKTHAQMTRAAEGFGMTVAAFSDLCVSYATACFLENGLKIDPPSLKDNSQAREELVGDSAAMSKLGSDKYNEWVSMLTPEKQEILKHCMGNHKRKAQAVTRSLDLRKLEKSYTSGIDTMISQDYHGDN